MECNGLTPFLGWREFNHTPSPLPPQASSPAAHLARSSGLGDDRPTACDEGHSPSSRGEAGILMQITSLPDTGNRRAASFSKHHRALGHRSTCTETIVAFEAVLLEAIFLPSGPPKTEGGSKKVVLPSLGGAPAVIQGWAGGNRGDEIQGVVFPFRRRCR